MQDITKLRQPRRTYVMRHHESMKRPDTNFRLLPRMTLTYPMAIELYGHVVDYDTCACNFLSICPVGRKGTIDFRCAFRDQV